MVSYCSSSSWCEVLYYTIYMIVWSRISGRIIVFFVWTWVIPAWGTEGCCKPAELYFVISFYSGSGICEECSSGLHILSFYVGHSDQSLISSEYRIFGFYELEYRFNLYSDYELAETFARDIRRRHNSILHTKWKPMRNPIAPYTFTRLNVHSRHSTDIRQTFK